MLGLRYGEREREKNKPCLKCDCSPVLILSSLFRWIAQESMCNQTEEVANGDIIMWVWTQHLPGKILTHKKKNCQRYRVE